MRESYSEWCRNTAVAMNTNLWKSLTEELTIGLGLKEQAEFGQIGDTLEEGLSRQRQERVQHTEDEEIWI